MTVLVFRLYKVKNVKSLKEALDIIRRLLEPVNDDAYFVKDWPKEEEEKSGWGSGFKRQIWPF